MPRSNPVAVKDAGDANWAAPIEIQPITMGNPDGVAGTLASANAGTVKLPAAGLAIHWKPPETLFPGFTLNPMMEMTLALAGALDHVTVKPAERVTVAALVEFVQTGAAFAVMLALNAPTSAPPVPDSVFDAPFTKKDNGIPVTFCDVARSPE